MTDGSYLAPVSKPPFKNIYHFRGTWEMIPQVQGSSFLTACEEQLWTFINAASWAQAPW